MQDILLTLSKSCTVYLEKQIIKFSNANMSCYTAVCVNLAKKPLNELNMLTTFTALL